MKTQINHPFWPFPAHNPPPNDPPNSIMKNIDFAKHYENLAENWANHLDTQFDTSGRQLELCLQLINALWDVYPEIIELIEIDPNTFAEKVSMYRLALHSQQNQPSGYQPAPM